MYLIKVLDPIYPNCIEMLLCENYYNEDGYMRTTKVVKVLKQFDEMDLSYIKESIYDCGAYNLAWEKDVIIEKLNTTKLANILYSNEKEL